MTLVPRWLARRPVAFHVKHNATGGASRSQRHGLRLIFALLPLLLVASACAGVQKPEGWAAPARAGDLVIIQTKAGVIAALRVSRDSATRLWSYPAEGDDIDLKAVYATPILEGDSVYVASYSGNIVALNIDDGRPLWGPTDLGQRMVATPVLDLSANRLWVATESGDLLVVDATDGSVERALRDVGDRIWSQPQLTATTVYVAALNSKLRAVDRSSGDVRWDRDVGAVAGDLAIDGDLLFVPSFDRDLHALDVAAGGNERWVTHGDSWFWSRPLVAGGAVYATTLSGTVYSLDRDSGKENWRFTGADTQIRAAPLLAGGVLVVASREGYIYGIGAGDGSLRWSKLLEGDRFLADPLLLASGAVLFVTAKGKLVTVTPDSGDLRRIAIDERG